MIITDNVSNKKIFTTDNYGKFKYLDGNRTDAEARANKIVKSINRVGYITNPIIVNENMEVIDGQGRLRAYEILGIPVEYVVHKGATIEHCQSLNLGQTNWKLKDFIYSHAVRGNDNYVWLIKMYEKFPKLGLNNIAYLAYHKGKSFISGCDEEILNGNIVCTRQERQTCEACAEYCNDFADIAKYIGGRAFIFYTAFAFCFSLPACDHERLADIIHAHYIEIPAQHTPNAYLKYFQELYNCGLRKQNRVYLEHEYEIR